MRISSAEPGKNPFLKDMFEYLFNIKLGNSIDDMLMRVTENRWLRKTLLKKLNSHGIVLSLLTGKHYAKPDPKNFQGKLLERYEQKVSRLISEYGNSLAH
jgi:hypothetical protein